MIDNLTIPSFILHRGHHRNLNAESHEGPYASALVWPSSLGLGVEDRRLGESYLGLGVPYFNTFFLRGTIMKYKFIPFSPWLLKSPVTIVIVSMMLVRTTIVSVTVAMIILLFTVTNCALSLLIL